MARLPTNTPPRNTLPRNTLPTSTLPTSALRSSTMLANPKLTPRQAEILELIRDHIQHTGYPPTRADIAQKLGFKSPNAAEEHLKALARKGAIEMIPGTSRGIRLPEENGLPIIGRVAAGQPLLAVEHVEDRLPIAAELFKPRADYLLRVRGDSMIKIGILDGDLLAVHRCEEAQNGQVIVARVDDEVTVKRLQRGKKKHELTLLPENDDFAPICVDLREQSFAIEGLSVGVLRQSL